MAPAAAPVEAPPAAPTVPLVDSARLERMCSLGLADQVLPEALDHARSLLAKLQVHAAADDRPQLREDLHALLGIAGEMGAKALGQQLRSVYGPIVDDGQWPADKTWIAQAQELFEQTERVIRTQHLRPQEPAA
jgi:HPt (histidine-containing phosphotransfer) domain-containing protein